MNYKEMLERIKSFKIEEELFKKYWRVLKLARRPTRVIYEIMLLLPR